MRHALILTVLSLTLVRSVGAATYPPSYRWQTITTDHFLIHFHQGEDELAKHAGAIAERAHTRLTPLLGWEPEDRTHLILTDHVDVSNGSATPFPNNRIEIYVSAPGADPSSSLEYYDNWLNLVITHEYAHILHLDQARGFGKLVRRVLGRDLFAFPNLWSPSWMIEGLATLMESEATGAGRLKGTYVDMVLRTAAIENRFATEAQASGHTPYWPGGNARYLYGAKFLGWLATTHGADKLREYLNEYSSNVLPFRVNATANDVYGKGMKQLWNEWSAVQQQTYRADRDRLGALTPREPLTDHGYETKYPIVSPDGTKLAYTHEGPFEQGTIRVRDLASGSDVATHGINSGSALSWNREGTAIAYSQLEYVGSVSLLSDLYVWEIGREERRLTKGARLKDPAFTPDGRSLVAIENRAGRNRIVEVDTATGAIRPVVEPPGLIQFSEPAVSPDGQTIAVAQWDRGRVDVVLYERQGREIANLTRSLARSTNASPRFSADGSDIYFSSDITGIANVFSVPTGGGAIRRLTNVYGGAFFPTSSDGRRFYYSDYSADGFDIAMFDATNVYDLVPRVVPTTVIGSSAVAEATEAPQPLVSIEPRPYSPWSSLRPRYWYPIVSTKTVGDDTRMTIGATTSGSDVLGFHSYTAGATITTGADDDSEHHYSILYNYDRLYPTISVGASRLDEDVVTFITDNGSATYSETTRRLFGQVTFPFRRIQSQSAVWGGVIRDDVDTSTTSEVSGPGAGTFGVFRGTLQGFRAGAMWTNARQYAFSVSQEDGMAVRLDYENLSRALGSDASLQQIRGDVRGYLTIPWARAPLGRHVLAARVAAAQNNGEYVLQRELRVGGSSDSGFPDLDIRHLPVRGYDTATLRGQRAAIGSIEYRFPIWEIERGPTTIPLFFNRLLGDVFIDGGRIWRASEFSASRNDTIASAGAEIGLDLTLGYLLPLRYRIGFAHLLRDPGKGDTNLYMALATSF